jgi:hypothetical protein
MNGVRALLLVGVCALFSASAQGQTSESGDSAGRILVLDLTGNEIPKGQIRVFSDLMATSWSRFEQLQVLTSRDIETTLGLEAKKQALGCDDDGCLAELAGALGADYVAYGSVGLLGEVHVFNLSLYDSKNTRSLSRQKFETRDVEAVSSLMDHAVEKMAHQGLGLGNGAPESSTASAGIEDEAVQEDSRGPSFLTWSGLALGGVGLVAAGAFTFLAYGQEQALVDGVSEDVDQSLFMGRLFSGIAIGSGVVGATGLGIFGWGMMAE